MPQRARVLSALIKDMQNDHKRKFSKEPDLDQVRQNQIPSLPELLPTELFHMILKCLPLASVLAIKFTCRAFYVRTITAEGGEVVDLKKAVVDEMPSRTKIYDPDNALEVAKWKEIQGVASVLIEREMRHNDTLWNLTCSNCARLKPYGVKGFGDKYFMQRDRIRYCSACLYNSLPRLHYPVPFLVHGKRMRHCPSCYLVVPCRNITDDIADDEDFADAEILTDAEIFPDDGTYCDACKDDEEFLED